MARDAGDLADLAQPRRVGGGARADDEDEVAMRRHRLHSRLPVLGRIADVADVGADDRREARGQRGDDLARILHAQRRLADIRNLLGIGDDQRGHLGGRGDDMQPPVGLAARALDLGLPLMARQPAAAQPQTFGAMVSTSAGV